MFSEGISWSVGVRERERELLFASVSVPARDNLNIFTRIFGCSCAHCLILLRDSSNTAKVKKLMSWFTCGVSKSSV